MELITKLHNRKSQHYYEIKKAVLSSNIPWNYFEQATPNTVVSKSVENYNDYEDSPFMSHEVLIRPNPHDDLWFPEPSRPSVDFIIPFLKEICEDNKIKVNSFMRINLNTNFPTKFNKLTIPHLDHQFPHKNIIVYFTDAGGETVVYDENRNAFSHFPEEDDIITFGGEYLHCIRPPKEKRRIVLVATYI